MSATANLWSAVAWLGAPELPLTRLSEVSLFQALLNYAPLKSLLPVPVFIALAPLVCWFFAKDWRRLDRDAGRLGAAVTTNVPRRGAPRRGLARYRGRRGRFPAAHGLARATRGRRALLRAATPPASPPAAPTTARFDYRPAVVFVLTAFVLTWQEYYGGRRFYGDAIRPWLSSLETGGQRWLQLAMFDELYGYGWWVLARFLGYVVVPFSVYKLLFPRDSLLDLGLRFRGLRSHAWIYALCLAVVLPAMALVASQPDFGTYYPFYKLSSRSWFDFAAWEAMYWFQFLTLEMFFRGFMLGALRRSLGSAAIFAMMVPYCMIHYGKPYLETNGAVVAGIVLGSLAMHTRSIYAGFFVHVLVAFLMDYLALWKLERLPTALLPW